MPGEYLVETRGRRDLRVCFRHLEQVPTSPNHVPALGGCLPIRSQCLGIVLGSGYPPVFCVYTCTCGRGSNLKSHVALAIDEVKFVRYSCDTLRVASTTPFLYL